MTKLKMTRDESNVQSFYQSQEQPPKVGRIVDFEKFSGMGLILQSDVTTIEFHSSGLTYPVRNGDSVYYRIECSSAGNRAVDITRND